ncbi:MAG TPA: glutathione S-transferase family protein [Steroidobacteraceae bacterium]|nr:glutathione S-transferase family protein [Steroidobacteraceae bacterium]
MLNFYDYLPSQNGFKIRLLLSHLGRACRTEYVSIFEGDGQRPDYLTINPWGAVPAIRLEDGRVLAESNAILFYLAQGSRFLPDDPFLQAKALQWMSFEADYVQSSMGSLRYWMLTGKLDRRPPALVASKRAASLKALAVLDRELAPSTFILGEHYGIADMSLFAYSHVARDAGLPLDEFPHVIRWIEAVRSQPGFAGVVHHYSIDPHSVAELP